MNSLFHLRLSSNVSHPRDSRTSAGNYSSITSAGNYPSCAIFEAYALNKYTNNYLIKENSSQNMAVLGHYKPISLFQQGQTA